MLMTDIFRTNSVMIGNNIRAAVDDGRADVIPIFLSDVPLLFDHRLLKLDVAMVTVSPPDRHGFCTLATNVDTAVSAVSSAARVIGKLRQRHFVAFFIYETSWPMFHLFT